MAYQLVKCLNTEFAVDWDVIERLCWSYHFNNNQSLFSEKKKVDDPNFSILNPFSYSLPDLYTVEVDWDKVRSRTALATAADMYAYSSRAKTQLRDIAYEVKFKVEQTSKIKQGYKQYLKDIQTTNAAEIENSVKDYAGYIDVCRFLRDTSADVVAIGSTIATGGAAAGLLGASSAMKGYGKYQDTGRVGAAVLYGSGSMLLGAFKVGGAKLSASAEYTLIFAQGTIEAGTSLAAGDSFTKAVGNGTLKIASTSGAQAIFGTDIVSNMFKKIPVPITVISDGVDVANQITEKVAKKMIEKELKTGMGVGMHLIKSDNIIRTVSSGIIDEVPIENMELLLLSVVHMNKGIGNGW